MSSNNADTLRVPGASTEDPTASLLRQVLQTVNDRNEDMARIPQMSRRRFVCTQCVSLTLGLLTCFALVLYALFKNEETLKNVATILAPQSISCEPDENFQTCATREVIEEILSYLLNSTNTLTKTDNIP